MSYLPPIDRTNWPVQLQPRQPTEFADQNYKSTSIVDGVSLGEARTARGSVISQVIREGAGFRAVTRNDRGGVTRFEQRARDGSAQLVGQPASGPGGAALWDVLDHQKTPPGPLVGEPAEKRLHQALRGFERDWNIYQKGRPSNSQKSGP